MGLAVWQQLVGISPLQYLQQTKAVLNRFATCVKVADNNIMLLSPHCFVVALHSRDCPCCSQHWCIQNHCYADKAVKGFDCCPHSA